MAEHDQPDSHADHQLGHAGNVHEGIPLIFGLVFAILVAPFALLRVEATSLNIIGLVAGLIAVVVTVAIVLKDIRDNHLDRRVARHLLVTTWLPYLFGVA